MSLFTTQLRQSIWIGTRKGWHSFIWICKIIVPTSLLIALLQWSGLLHRVDFLLNPLMRLINLPGEAVLPIIGGLLINLYAAIAIMIVLPFTIKQMTLIAVFTLIAHNLIVEGIIQQKSGINIVKILLVRIIVAVLTVLIVSQFLTDTTSSIVVTSAPAVTPPLVEVLKVWAINTIVLLIKILLIVTAIMVALECLQSLGWTEYLLRFFKPVTRVLGLSDRTALLWVTAVIFGLMYGGAVIMEEARKGTMTKEELERLHISIGINHSMVEDPALFLVLGLNGFWLWVPKFIMAAVVVQGYRAFQYLRKESLQRWLVARRLSRKL
ncbi:MAG: nucleoside recognition domain-containing protein [Chloroflexota bacterium]